MYLISDIQLFDVRWCVETAASSVVNAYLEHILFLVSWGGVILSSLATLATNRPIVSARMMDDDECGVVGGMRIGTGNRSARMKTAPVPLSFFNSHSGGESKLGPLGTSIVPAPGDCEDGEFGGMKIGRGNRIHGENLPQRLFIHHKSHLTRPGLEPGSLRWEASD
jgi:hypothetical protein